MDIASTQSLSIPRRRGGSRGRCASGITQRAFTLIELLIGLVVTSLVIGAVAAIAMAVAQGWSSADPTQSLSVQSLALQSKLQSLLCGSCYVGYASTGGGSTAPMIFYWAGDTGPGADSGDGVPEICEMQLLMLDSTTGSLYLYSVPANLNASQQTLANTQVAYADMSSAASAAAFAALPYVSKICLCGPGANANEGNHVTVTSLTISMENQNDPSATVRTCTSVDFVFTLTSGDGQTMTTYATATLRAPATQPS